MTHRRNASFILGAILGLAFFQLISVVLRATPAQAGLLAVAGGPLLAILAALGSRAFCSPGTHRHAREAWVVCGVLALSCVALHEGKAATMVCATVGCLAFVALGGALAGLEANVESEAEARSAWQGSVVGLVASWPCDEVAFRALDSYTALPILVFAGLLLSVGLLRRRVVDSPRPQRSNSTRRFPLAALGIGFGLATLFGAATHYGRVVCHSIHFDCVHWVAFVASTLIFVLPLSTLGRLDIVVPTLLLGVMLHGLARARPSGSVIGATD